MVIMNLRLLSVLQPVPPSDRKIENVISKLNCNNPLLVNFSFFKCYNSVISLIILSFFSYYLAFVFLVRNRVIAAFGRMKLETRNNET